MTKKKPINEKITDRLSKFLLPDFKKFEKEKDPLKRVSGLHEIFYKGYFNYVKLIHKLSEKEFLACEKGIMKDLQQIQTNFINEAFERRISDETLKIENLGFFIVKPNVKDSDKLAEASKVDKILENPKTLERLYRLELISRFSYQMSIMYYNLLLEPLSDLEQIIKKHFHADANWYIAISILAVHENLIKKKLIDLKVTEEEIIHLLKKSKFEGLVNHLRKLIEKKEKRKLTLSFYKSPALRAIRNKLEHEGYKQPVTKKEALELLKEIKKFENELYKEKKTKKKKS